MKLQFDVEAVRRFCRERGIARLELFGSALRDDFAQNSDVDLLATVRPGVKCGLFEWVDWQEGLARIFRRPVDLVSRRAVERSRNPYRKHSILSHTEPIYVEG
jgi:predicted nucleotidyltransferase